MENNELIRAKIIDMEKQKRMSFGNDNLLILKIFNSNMNNVIYYLCINIFLRQKKKILQHNWEG